MLRFLLLFLAQCYRIAYRLHHRLFLRPGVPLEYATLYVIGSFRIGGAGKTPFCAWLAQKLDEGSFGKPGQHVAILCHSKAKDEAEMLRRKLAGAPQVKVFTTGNRYRTAHELDRDFNIILCDDGFEDSRLTGATVIRLDRGDLPRHIRDLVPAGLNRSLEQDHDKPALILEEPDILFRIDSVRNSDGEACPENPDYSLCGIGSPERFVRDLATRGIKPVRHIAMPDHSPYLGQRLSKLLCQGSTVVITEKDSARLAAQTLKNRQVYIAYQETVVSASAQRAISALF